MKKIKCFTYNFNGITRFILLYKDIFHIENFYKNTNGYYDTSPKDNNYIPTPFHVCHLNHLLLVDVENEKNKGIKFSNQYRLGCIVYIELLSSYIIEYDKEYIQKVHKIKYKNKIYNIFCFCKRNEKFPIYLIKSKSPD